MINTHDNVWIPSDGYKYISNGETWTNQIILGRSDNINNWHDTNDEPTEPPEPEEDATIDDYAEQLERMGVEV